MFKTTENFVTNQEVNNEKKNTKEHIKLMFNRIDLYNNNRKHKSNNNNNMHHKVHNPFTVFNYYFGQMKQVVK